MNGNAKQRRAYNRRIDRKLLEFSDEMVKMIRPMIKEECLKDFDEIAELLKIVGHDRKEITKWP